MRNLKGQGASEYLILLAVVLIVGMVALALLTGFTQAGGEAKTKEYKEYWSATTPFMVPDMAQQNSTLFLTVQNTEPERLIINNVTLADKSGNTSVYSPSGGLSLRGGQRRTFGFTAPRSCDNASYDYFEYTLSITYSTLDVNNKVQWGSKPISGVCVSG